MPVVMLRKTRCHGNSAGIDRCWFYLLGEASCRLIECEFGPTRGESFWILEAGSCNSICHWCRHLGFVDGYHRCRRRLANASWRAADHTREGVGTLKITKVKIRGSIRRGKRIISSTRSWTNLCKSPFCVFMLLLLFLPLPPGWAVN